MRDLQNVVCAVAKAFMIAWISWKSFSQFSTEVLDIKLLLSRDRLNKEPH